jgi:uncharacterized protein
MLLSVKVTPKAKQNRVTRLSEYSYRVSTTAAAEKNQANAAVVTLLAKFLHLRPNQVWLVAGQTSREKIVGIDDAARPTD